MGIRYPNGKKFDGTRLNKQGANKKQSYSNRGMTLEEDINEANHYYLEREIAVIHKKPTPVQIVQVDYPRRSAAVIKEAYFKQQSTTDYNGIYRGKHIDFEAKETRNESSFPLQNFHEHQIMHMKAVVKQGGIAFVLLRFASSDEVYFLDSEHLFTFWERQVNGGRKSITKKEVVENGHFLKIGLHPRIDYLKVLDHHYFK